MGCASSQEAKYDKVGASKSALPAAAPTPPKEAPVQSNEPEASIEDNPQADMPGTQTADTRPSLETSAQQVSSRPRHTAASTTQPSLELPSTKEPGPVDPSPQAAMEGTMEGAGESEALQPASDDVSGPVTNVGRRSFIDPSLLEHLVHVDAAETGQEVSRKSIKKRRTRKNMETVQEDTVTAQTGNGEGDPQPSVDKTVVDVPELAESKPGKKKHIALRGTARNRKPKNQESQNGTPRKDAPAEVPVETPAEVPANQEIHSTAHAEDVAGKDGGAVREKVLESPAAQQKVHGSPAKVRCTRLFNKDSDVSPVESNFSSSGAAVHGDSVGRGSVVVGNCATDNSTVMYDLNLAAGRASVAPRATMWDLDMTAFTSMMSEVKAVKSDASDISIDLVGGLPNQGSALPPPNQHRAMRQSCASMASCADYSRSDTINAEVSSSSFAAARSPDRRSLDLTGAPITGVLDEA